jgi:plastocyanin
MRLKTILPLAALLLTAACSGPAPLPTATATIGVRPTETVTPVGAPPATATIEYAEGLSITIQDKRFQPPALAVIVHSTVTWTNADDVEHALSLGEPDAPAADIGFQSDPLASGATYSFTFETAGDYPYYCRIHPEMRGLIHVAP